MSRRAWIAVSAAVVAVGIGAGIGALFATGGSTQSSPTTPTTTAPASGFQSFSLPLTRNASALTLADTSGKLLVGIAARAGGPVQVAALRADTPVAPGDLRISLDGREVTAEPCGPGCSQVSGSVLSGSPSSLTVGADSSSVSFELPAALPPSGSKLFARAQRTMDALQSFRFTENLSSGGKAVVSHLDVQAPNRLRLRTTGGFRSVLIGRTRWDYAEGRWERTPFPGLKVADVLMWFRAQHPRVVSRHGDVSTLAAFGLQPVPAWFRLDVTPSGRVLEAEMLAPSHFMVHRYSDFNGGISITPPVRK